MIDTEEALLSVRHLSVAFGGHLVVDDISFTLDRGETLALVGESGSGKSVSSLSILQLLPYPYASHPSGSIKLGEQELIGAPQPLLQNIRGGKIGMIFQEPMTALNPLHTIGRQIEESLFLHKGLKNSAAQKRALELLQLVKIPNAEQRLTAYPHELSGGQRQRVMIAMALAGEPDILIADEPTTALDVTVQAQILDLLAELQQKLGMAILLITHDLNIVRRVASHVCVMRQGQIVESGTTEAIFTHPQHDYTKLLLGSEPSGAPVPVPANSDTVLKADNIKVWFPIKKGVLRRIAGYVKAVDGISLNLRAGETLGIVGESGSGKTTLAHAILRMTKATSGNVYFNAEDLFKLKSSQLRRLRRNMGIVFQDPFSSLSPRLSARDIILEGLRWHEPKLNAQAQEEALQNILAEVGLTADMANRYPHEFSGGQRQRLSIARALILKPKLLVLDEPTSALDRTVQAQVIDLLRNLQAKYGLAYLLITHDLSVVRVMAHKLIVMQNGAVVEEGTAEDIFERPQQDYTKNLLAAAFSASAA